MKNKNLYKLVVTHPDGNNSEYLYNDILTTLTLKLFFDSASGWKTATYEKIEGKWIELGSNK